MPEWVDLLDWESISCLSSLGVYCVIFFSSCGEEARLKGKECWDSR